MSRMRFGIFMAPFHPAGISPTVLIDGDLELIDHLDRLGFEEAWIGTPDDAIAQIERLVKQSNGGFGAYLQLAHDWAAPSAKLRGYELFARNVAPHFQGQYRSTADAKARARAARPALAANNLKAVEQSTAKYQAELAAKGKRD